MNCVRFARCGMFKLTLVPFLLITAYVCPQTCSSEPIQWSATDGGNGHFYELIEGAYQWSQAYENARSLTFRGAQGHLATLTSFPENAFVREGVTAGKTAWIGLTDSEDYGGNESINMPDPSRDGWRWVTDEPVDYVAWSSNEPNNLNNEDFAIFQGNSVWNDGQANWTFNFIVEYDTHPTPGDTNDDGRVDITDLNNVRNHFGEGEILGPPVFGEAFPFNGIVDLGDLNLVRNHFGESLQPIPEPASVYVMIAGVFAVCSLNRGRRRNMCAA